MRALIFRPFALSLTSTIPGTLHVLNKERVESSRIGQVYDVVWIYTMRYKDSVEDRVYELLSDRLEKINSLFGRFLIFWKMYGSMWL
jgi:hypothetical protein